jgi:hypothetical protein
MLALWFRYGLLGFPGFGATALPRLLGNTTALV